MLNAQIKECRHVYNILIFALNIQTRIFKKDFYIVEEEGEIKYYHKQRSGDKSYCWTKYYSGSGFDLNRKPWRIKKKEEFNNDKEKEKYLNKKKTCENYKTLYNVYKRYFPDCKRSNYRSVGKAKLEKMIKDTIKNKKEITKGNLRFMDVKFGKNIIIEMIKNLEFLFKDEDSKEKYIKKIKQNSLQSNTQRVVWYYRNILYPSAKKFLYSVLQYENQKMFRQRKSLISNAKNGRKVGRMRYKGEDFFNSFTYNTTGFKFIKTGKQLDILKLNRLGYFPIKAHRPFIKDGKINNVIIKKEGSKWFASLAICSKTKPKIKKGKKGIIGIDLGLGDFIYDSNEKNWPRKKILEDFEDKLAKANKKLSRCKRGSKNRKKVRNILSNIYAERTRVREDYIHKISHDYSTNYSIVCAEDLNIKGMAEKKQREGKGGKTRRKHVLDACWGKFLNILEYKLKERGGRLIRVSPEYTTQTCSKCGNIKEGKDKLQKGDRVYNCKKCGLSLNRDYNASWNILERGKEILKLEKENLKKKKVKLKLKST